SEGDADRDIIAQDLRAHRPPRHTRGDHDDLPQALSVRPLRRSGGEPSARHRDELRRLPAHRALMIAAASQPGLSLLRIERSPAPSPSTAAPRPRQSWRSPSSPTAMGHRGRGECVVTSNIRCYLPKSQAAKLLTELQQIAEINRAEKG